MRGIIIPMLAAVLTVTIVILISAGARAEPGTERELRVPPCPDVFMMPPLFACLDLSDEQKSRIRKLFAREEPKMKAFMKTIFTERKMLMKNVHAGKADESAIRHSLLNILEAEQAVALHHTLMVKTAREVLTDVQRQKLGRFKQDLFGTDGEHSPIFGQPRENRPAIPPFLDCIVLSEEQKTQIRTGLQTYKKDIDALDHRHRAERLELMRLIHADLTDEVQIRTHVVTLAKTETELALLHAKTLVFIKEKLTPEQRKQITAREKEFSPEQRSDCLEKMRPVPPHMLHLAPCSMRP